MPKQRVERTRAAGSMTEAAFWSWLRSGLRRMSMKWKPLYTVVSDAKRPVDERDKIRWGNRIKFVYQCSECEQWFPRGGVEVDHKVGLGSLKCFEDLPGFCERLFCEKENLQVLCKWCHRVKTNTYRKRLPGRKLDPDLEM